MKDFAPVSLVATVEWGLVASNQAPFKSAADLIAAAKAAPGKIDYSSGGPGSPQHLAMAMFASAAGISLTHVPYKGAAPALADLLGSHVDFYFPGFPAALPFVKNKQMKMLAVSTAQRAAGAPDVPTVAEAAGIRDFDFSLWGGFFAPRGTPKEIVSLLNAAINEVLALPDIKAKMADADADIIPMSVDAFAAFMKRESEKYQRIVQQTGIKPE